MQRDQGRLCRRRKRPGGFQFAEDTVVMALRFGTPRLRCATRGTTVNSITGFVAGTRSATRAVRCGVEKMGPIVARALAQNVLDDAGRSRRERRSPRTIASGRRGSGVWSSGAMSC
jgi:hypothetical protein